MKRHKISSSHPFLWSPMLIAFSRFHLTDLPLNRNNMSPKKLLWSDQVVIFLIYMNSAGRTWLSSMPQNTIFPPSNRHNLPDNCSPGNTYLIPSSALNIVRPFFTDNFSWAFSRHIPQVCFMVFDWSFHVKNNHYQMMLKDLIT